MADETAAGTQAASGAASQADAATQSPADTPTPEERIEALEAKLTRARTEVKNLRTHLNGTGGTTTMASTQAAATTQPQAGATAPDPEYTRLQRELDQAKTDLRTERVTRTVEQAAKDAFAVYPDTVALLIVPHLEFDDDGEPTNLTSLLNTLRRKNPRLFNPPSGDGGARPGVAHGSSMNALIRQAAGRQ